MKTGLLKKLPVASRSAANRETSNKNEVSTGSNQSLVNSSMSQPVQFTLWDAKAYIKRTSKDYDYPWKKVPTRQQILEHIEARGTNWKRIEREYDKEEKKEEKKEKKKPKKRRKNNDVSTEDSTKSPKKKQKTSHYTQEDPVVDETKKKKKRKVQEDTKTKKTKKEKTEDPTPDTDVIEQKVKKPVKRKIEKDDSDSSEKEKTPPKKKYKKKEKKEKKDDGHLPTFEEALTAIETGELPDDKTSWKSVGKAIEASIDKEDFGAVLKRLITVLYAYSSKANQYKFPPATAEKKIISEYGEGLREIKGPRKYESEDDQVLQQLRWISTTLYNYIKAQKKPLEEVQTLWDGEFLHITENSLANNTEIIELLNNKDDFMTFLRKYKGKEESKDRFERHPERLRKALKGKDTIGPIDALSRHLDNKKKSNLHVPDSNTVSDETPRKMHAEIRLGINYLNGKAPKKQKEGTKKIWVAGVKRPCFACYVRLTVLKESFESQKDIELVHNPHKGLLWPSEPAWTASTKKDKRAALKRLGLFAYLKGMEDGNMDAMQELVQENKIALSSGTKTGRYDRDTDSEGEND